MHYTKNDKGRLNQLSNLEYKQETETWHPSLTEPLSWAWKRVRNLMPLKEPVSGYEKKKKQKRVVKLRSAWNIHPSCVKHRTWIQHNDRHLENRTKDLGTNCASKTVQKGNCWAATTTLTATLYREAQTSFSSSCDLTTVCWDSTSCWLLW